MSLELDNLHKNTLGEIPLGSFLRIKVKTKNSAEHYLSKIKEVVKTIIVLNGNSEPIKWKKELPKWFSVTMTDINKDILLADKTKWHFESWIDAIIHREWHWYSSSINDFCFEINLSTSGMPYMIDPFMYILTSLELKDYSIDEL